MLNTVQHQTVDPSPITHRDISAYSITTPGAIDINVDLDLCFYRLLNFWHIVLPASSGYPRLCALQICFSGFFHFFQKRRAVVPPISDISSSSKFHHSFKL
jgi:hypothetical protein